MTPDTISRLVRLRRELHQYPELSGQEQNTAARVAKELAELGADRVVTGIGGHGVAAIFDSGIAGPTVAVRCELDGLPIQEQSDVDYVSRVPDRGHLCGHDGHMVMVLGVAEEIGRARPKKGRVVLIFQPAEETGKGALAFRADRQFAKIAPDYVFSLHNLPGLGLGKVQICTGAANCASRGMKIALTGKTSHAAAPLDGVSPAGALSALMPKMAELGAGGALDDAFALTTVTHASLGEPTFGVSPGKAELWVTLRTVTDVRMQQLMAEAEALATQHAEVDGLQCQILYDDVFDSCVNHADAVEILVSACKAGRVEHEMTENPQKFSEDFGQFSKGAITAMLWLGAGQDHPQLHNPDYDFPDAIIPVGTGIFVNSIRSLLG